jgi:hypothetical protein
VAPAGVNASPGTIDEVVTLMNALPRPLTVSCYLESLERPLRVDATSSIFSVQAAVGARSPRVFVFSGRLITAFAVAGDAANLVEMGELVDDRRTRKGELALPFEGPIPPAAPYDHPRDGSGTSCRGCHRDEQPSGWAQVTQAYASAALRPTKSSRVSIDRLRTEQAGCDPNAEPARCAFLTALLAHGEVLPQEFPATWPTIFQ